jgi:hypothetical protein
LSVGLAEPDFRFDLRSWQFPGESVMPSQIMALMSLADVVSILQPSVGVVTTR